MKGCDSLKWVLLVLLGNDRSSGVYKITLVNNKVLHPLDNVHSLYLSRYLREISNKKNIQRNITL